VCSVLFHHVIRWRSRGRWEQSLLPPTAAVVQSVRHQGLMAASYYTRKGLPMLPRDVTGSFRHHYQQQPPGRPFWSSCCRCHCYSRCCWRRWWCWKRRMAASHNRRSHHPGTPTGCSVGAGACPSLGPPPRRWSSRPRT
jgi:hypothetical protein